ncbi:MAG: hypothetical protein NVS4B11_26480 [Ktedonobacteraceae bacterium]
MERIHMTEYLDLDLNDEMWYCHTCGKGISPARENYKKGCLLYNRDPREIHPAGIEGTFSFSPDPTWVRIVEFYCPSCGTQVETEYLPPGHPITYDIELDIDSLKARLARGEYVIRDAKLTLVEVEL